MYLHENAKRVTLTSPRILYPCPLIYASFPQFHVPMQTWTQKPHMLHIQIYFFRSTTSLGSSVIASSLMLVSCGLVKALGGPEFCRLPDRLRAGAVPKSEVSILVSIVSSEFDLRYSGLWWTGETKVSCIKPESSLSCRMLMGRTPVSLESLRR